MNGQRLQAREDAVAAEHGHEPGQAGRRQAPPAGDRAARSAVRRDRRGCAGTSPSADPSRTRAEAPPRATSPGPAACSPAAPPPTSVARAARRAQHRRDDVQLGRPRPVGLDPDPEGQAVLVEPRRGRRRDHRGPPERLRARRRARSCPSATRVEYVPFFSSASLTSNRSAKSHPASMRTVEVDRLLVVVEDRQLLVEAVADRALADHRQLRVDVDRAGPGNEEEARLEVLQIVDGERVEPLAVHGQHPFREEARVEREEAGRVGERRLDVAARSR